MRGPAAESRALAAQRHYIVGLMPMHNEPCSQRNEKDHVSMLRMQWTRVHNMCLSRRRSLYEPWYFCGYVKLYEVYRRQNDGWLAVLSIYRALVKPTVTTRVGQICASVNSC